jgi:hypothetical protein
MGTFSADALMRIGGGTEAERTAKATEKIVDLTRRPTTSSTKHTACPSHKELIYHVNTS